MKRRYKDPGKIFRELIARPEGVFGFGVENAAGALSAEKGGSELIYAGGWSIAGSKNRPDMGQVTMTEQLAQMREIVRSTELSVIADIDDGYGDAKNVIRTVSEFLSIHEYHVRTRRVRCLAGIHIEDQVLPKRCGHVVNKKLVPTKVMVGKIKAGNRVRDDIYPSSVIIARTDAFNSRVNGSMEEAIGRGIAYADAGADLVWCEFNQPDESLAEKFAEGVQKNHPKLPLAFNYSPSLSWLTVPENNRLTFERLAQIGYKFYFVTIADFHAHTMATYDYAKRFREVGARALWEMQEKKKGHPTENHQALMDVDHWLKIEREFIPDAEEGQGQGEGFKG